MGKSKRPVNRIDRANSRFALSGFLDPSVLNDKAPAVFQPPPSFPFPFPSQAYMTDLLSLLILCEGLSQPSTVQKTNADVHVQKRFPMRAHFCQCD